MPRLEVIVTLGAKRQEFLLDAPLITLGRSLSSTLVLPLAHLAETHVLIEPAEYAGSPGLHLRPASPFTPTVLLNGSPLPSAGQTLPLHTPFTLDFPPPPAPGPATPPTSAASATPLEAARSAPEIPILHLDLIARPPVLGPALATASGEAGVPTVLAALILTATTLAAVALILTRTPPHPTALLPPPPAAAPTLTPPQIPPVSPSPAPLLSTAPQPPPPSADTSAQNLSSSPAATLPPPTTGPVAPSPEPSPDAAARKEKDEAAAEAKRARDAGLRQLLDGARGDAEAGRDAKDTTPGRAALAEAKRLLQTQLTRSSSTAALNFPPDNDPKVLVKFDPATSTYTTRGYLDQTNTAGVPFRTYYLTRLKPTSPESWQHLGTELLK